MAKDELLAHPGEGPVRAHLCPLSPTPLPLEVQIPVTSVKELVPLALLPGIKADTIVSSIIPGQRSDFTIPITMILLMMFIWSGASVWSVKQ